MRLLLVQFIAITALCGGLIAAAPVARRLTTPQTMPRCEGGRWPEFSSGFAALGLDLGESMGTPLECEHAAAEVGDTDQQTSTGLAHYDRDTDTQSFHQGTDNWALTSGGLVFWAGTAPQAPSGVVALPSPGSARLAAAARLSAPGATPDVIAASHQPRVAVPTPSSSPLLTGPQVGRVAALLGIKYEQVQSMTLASLSIYTQSTGGSVAEVARSINTATP